MTSVRRRLSACSAGGLERGGAAVDDAHLDAVFVGLAGHAALAGQHEALAMRRQMPADPLLRQAIAVQRRGVEVRHACVQRRQQQAGGGSLGHRFAVGVADVHAAQTDGRNLERPQAPRRPRRRRRLQERGERALRDLTGHARLLRLSAAPGRCPPAAAAPAGAAPGSTAAPARRWRWARAPRGWRRRIRGPAARCRSSRRPRR